MPNYIAEMWEEISQAQPWETPLPEDDMMSFKHIFYCGAGAVLQQVARSGKPLVQVMNDIYQEVAEYKRTSEGSKSGAKLRKPGRR